MANAKYQEGDTFTDHKLGLVRVVTLRPANYLEWDYIVERLDLSTDELDAGWHGQRYLSCDDMETEG